MIALAMTMALTVPAEAPVCAPRDPAAVVKTAVDLFAAASADDRVGFKALTNADFYAYDNGRTFRGMELFDLIKAAHVQGRRFEWTVQDADVRVGCDTATLIYVNRGAVGDAKSMSPITWLEADLLRWEDGHWKVAFLSSQRAAK